MSTPLVLVLNCGSSSVKFAVLDSETGAECLTGIAERLGSPQSQMIVKYQGEKRISPIPNADHQRTMAAIVELLKSLDGVAEKLGAVGHRVVHGGEYFAESVLIDDEVVAKIRECGHLAPLHNYANATGIEAAREAFPHLPHTAVFDTAFHQSMPQKAYLYPLPYELYEKHHVRRYGFHGTSFRYIAGQAAELLAKPLEETSLIIAHLGNGASVAAAKGGKSLDTSMGMTPNEGVVHGTRCGSIDPSIHGYLAKTLDVSLDDVTDMLWKQSGLLGISGISNDCRAIEEAAEEFHERAQLALDIYSYRLAKEIAAQSVALGRPDAVVFTGGIGENSSQIRAKVISYLEILDLHLDRAKNEACIRGESGMISSAGSCVALVIPTNEELLIARDAAKQIGKATSAELAAAS